MHMGDDTATERHRVVPYAAVRYHVGIYMRETDRQIGSWLFQDWYLAEYLRLPLWCNGEAFFCWGRGHSAHTVGDENGIFICECSCFDTIRHIGGSIV